jgi:hypothetical protein
MLLENVNEYRGIRYQILSGGKCSPNFLFFYYYFVLVMLFITRMVAFAIKTNVVLESKKG